MKLRQLQFIREVASGLNVSDAAARLRTSQPSVSRQIRVFETELGVQIFERDKRRITGITRSGRVIVEAIAQALQACENVQAIGSEHSGSAINTLTVAASHTHARYILPKVVQRFTVEYPKVRLSLRQGNSQQAIEWVSTGEADICIGTDSNSKVENVVLVPCNKHYRVVLTPLSHPLTAKRKLNLEMLAEYPIITYDKGYVAHTQIMQAFSRRGLKPNIVLTAMDVDVMKTYVKCGLGVAIIADLAYSASEDRGFFCIDARHLFEFCTIHVGVKRGGYLPGYARDFIYMFAPNAANAASLRRRLGFSSAVTNNMAAV